VRISAARAESYALKHPKPYVVFTRRIAVYVDIQTPIHSIDVVKRAQAAEIAKEVDESLYVAIQFRCTCRASPYGPILTISFSDPAYWVRRAKSLAERISPIIGDQAPSLYFTRLFASLIQEKEQGVLILAQAQQTRISHLRKLMDTIYTKVLNLSGVSHELSALTPMKQRIDAVGRALDELITYAEIEGGRDMLKEEHANRRLAFQITYKI
jgi:hypothetical protein